MVCSDRFEKNILGLTQRPDWAREACRGSKEKSQGSDLGIDSGHKEEGGAEEDFTGRGNERARERAAEDDSSIFSLGNYRGDMPLIEMRNTRGKARLY